MEVVGRYTSYLGDKGLKVRCRRAMIYCYEGIIITYIICCHKMKGKLVLKHVQLCTQLSPGFSWWLSGTKVAL